MTVLDPRRWNLIPSAVLLASACQVSSIPIDDDGVETDSTETSGNGTETSGSETSTTGSEDPTTGSESPTTGDDDPYSCGDDCGPHEYCDEGGCWPNVECYDDYFCEPGEYCDLEPYYQPCRSLEPVSECTAPELAEIPLPAEAQGELLDLHFADLDGDDRDELLILRPGELVVVHDDQTVWSAMVDPMAEAFAVVEADGDQQLDVILTSTQPDHGGRMLGLGDGSFAPMVGLTLPGLREAQAMRWLGGDTQELAALDNIGAVVSVSALASDAPLVEPFAAINFNDGFDHVYVHDFEPDMIDEVLVYRNCSITYVIMGVDPEGASLWFDQTCRGYVERAGTEVQQIVTTAAGAGTDMRLLVDYGTPNEARLVPGQIDDLVGAGSLGLVLVNDSQTRLLSFSGRSANCVSAPAGLPGAVRVESGDFSVNPGVEFVLVGQDQLSMWARP